MNKTQYIVLSLLLAVSGSAFGMEKPLKDKLNPESIGTIEQLLPNHNNFKVWYITNVSDDGRKMKLSASAGRGLRDNIFHDIFVDGQRLNMTEEDACHIFNLLHSLHYYKKTK